MRRSSAPPSTAAPPRRSRPRQSRPTSPSRAQRHRGRQSRLGPRGPRTPPPGGGGLVPFAPSGETRQRTSPATRLATGGPRGRVPSGVRRPPGCHRGLLGTGTRATCYYQAMVGGGIPSFYAAGSFAGDSARLLVRHSRTLVLQRLFVGVEVGCYNTLERYFWAIKCPIITDKQNN